MCCFWQNQSARSYHPGRGHYKCLTQCKKAVAEKVKSVAPLSNHLQQCCLGGQWEPLVTEQLEHCLSAKHGWCTTQNSTVPSSCWSLETACMEWMCSSFRQPAAMDTLLLLLLLLLLLYNDSAIKQPAPHFCRAATAGAVSRMLWQSIH